MVGNSAVWNQQEVLVRQWSWRAYCPQPCTAANLQNGGVFLQIFYDLPSALGITCIAYSLCSVLPMIFLELYRPAYSFICFSIQFCCLAEYNRDSMSCSQTNLNSQITANNPFKWSLKQYLDLVLNSKRWFECYLCGSCDTIQEIQELLEEEMATISILPGRSKEEGGALVGFTIYKVHWRCLTSGDMQQQQHRMLKLSLWEVSSNGVLPALIFQDPEHKWAGRKKGESWNFCPSV